MSTRNISFGLSVTLLISIFVFGVSPVTVAGEASPAGKYDTQAVTDFYRGKTITVVVGFAPGGGYDIAARIVAKHLGKYIPGNPTVIVSNRPGGGSVVAANLVYETSRRDGTTIVDFHPQMLLQQALGREGIKFDGLKYNWLGSLNSSSTACAVHKDTGVSDIKQIMGPEGKILTMGAEAPGSGITDGTAVIRAALALKFRMIYGYTGQRPIVNAVLSREVDGMCTSWDAFNTTLKNLFEPKPLVNMLVINAAQLPDDPRLKDVAAAQAVARSDSARKLLRIIDGPRAIAYPYAVAPGVPTERLSALRDAFAKMLKDQAFVADYKKSGSNYDPKSWMQVTEIVKELLTMEEDTRSAIREALKRREGP